MRAKPLKGLGLEGMNQSILIIPIFRAALGHPPVSSVHCQMRPPLLCLHLSNSVYTTLVHESWLWYSMHSMLANCAGVLQVDPSMTFDQVGGLGHYISLLKEMIFLPLIYPELYEKFNVTPPRGVLFYGPPGDNHSCHFVALHRNIGSVSLELAFWIHVLQTSLYKARGSRLRTWVLVMRKGQRDMGW
jgi:hypothetical protein